MKLQEFLDKKADEYAVFNPNRFQSLWQDINTKFDKPNSTVHLVGTNGKGTTGRFLAHYLYKLGFSVGHFTSPHIHQFNERFWFNGELIENNILELAHQNILRKTEKHTTEISYFEWMSLLAIELFGGCDFFICEAGVGGEHDSTNVFDKQLSLVTKIGIDHTEFLGNTLKEIAITKINSIRNPAIILKNQEKLVLDIFFEQEGDKRNSTYDISQYEQNQINKFIEKKNYPNFLKENLELALSAVKFFKAGIAMNLLDDLVLEGRFQKIKHNLTVDVGHNELGAREIVKAVDGKIVLLYNTYKDKDYKSVLEILRPIIKRIEIVELDEDRIVEKDILEGTLSEMNVKYCDFKEIKEEENYLAFGSFMVVAKVLKDLNEE